MLLSEALPCCETLTVLLCHVCGNTRVNFVTVSPHVVAPCCEGLQSYVCVHNLV
jgi:hypothetical protein